MFRRNNERRHSLLGRFRRDEQGAMAVEFSLVAVPFLALMFASVEGAMVFWTNQVLDEGVDVPEVKVGIVIGGSGSTRQAKQRLGRILRQAGNSRATLYEVVCADTNEEVRSRQRRGSDAYEGTRHCRV